MLTKLLPELVDASLVLSQQFVFLRSPIFQPVDFELQLWQKSGKLRDGHRWDACLREFVQFL